MRVEERRAHCPRMPETHPLHLSAFCIFEFRNEQRKETTSKKERTNTDSFCYIFPPRFIWPNCQRIGIPARFFHAACCIHFACTGQRREKCKTAFIIFQSVDRAAPRATVTRRKLQHRHGIFASVAAAVRVTQCTAIFVFSFPLFK